MTPPTRQPHDPRLAASPDGLTTAELVDALRRRGLHASPEGLRLDAHRGLISPRMPGTGGPGRGNPTQWSAMSVRRAVLTARLRRRGVNGHVLPLLLFLFDGWGWAAILPAVQEAATKAWELDRRHLNRPTRVRSRDDVIDNAERLGEWSERPDWEAVRSFRTWLHTAVWTGAPEPGSSIVPILTTTLAEALGLALDPQERAAAAALARGYEQRRAALGLATADLPAWLEMLDAATVERGRVLFWDFARLMRLVQRLTDPIGGGGNPLTLGGTPPAELAADLRAQPGRLTPAQVLGVCIAQAMVMAALMGDPEPSGTA